jgi:poly(beta-D-mannuronate) lyase
MGLITFACYIANYIVMKRILVFLLALLAGVNVYAKQYHIRSAADLATLSLKAGDKVLLEPGEWIDQHLVFKGIGTEKDPITLVAQEPVKEMLKGGSTLLIDGSWLVADGLNFGEGFSAKNDVIIFSEGSTNCRLTNSAIVDYNPTDKTKDYRWVSLHGEDNRVDHCYFKGKTHQGSTMVVWLSAKPNHHRIDHNYFGNRPDLGVNGGESIRIGTSTWSMFDSYTTVEDNIFNQCNGEMEVISNKSCHNTIRNNLMYECVGTLTLRHGNYASVYGNYIIGNGVEGTGGIRVIGESHKVYNNYLQGLTGKGLKAAISIMDALENPPLNGYWQVKNARILGNTIVNCAEAINIGSGKDDKRRLPPVACTVAENTVILPKKLLIFTDTAQSTRFEDNKVDSLFKSVVPIGFKLAYIPYKKDTSGIYILGKGNVGAFKDEQMIFGNDNTQHEKNNTSANSNNPFYNNTSIGPAWLLLKKDFIAL